MPGRDHREVEQDQIIDAFDRAIIASKNHVQSCPEDSHQLHALRRAKTAVVSSFEHGHELSLGVLHTINGVGHWVVQQLRDHLHDDGALPKRQRCDRGATPTPHSFTWWYPRVFAHEQ